MTTVCGYTKFKKYQELKEVEDKLEELERKILALDDLEKRAVHSAKRYALRLKRANLLDTLNE